MGDVIRLPIVGQPPESGEELTRDQRRSRRKHEVRAVTLSPKRASHPAFGPGAIFGKSAAAVVRREYAAELAELDALRPKTRADCANVPRPCPFVGCRFNLFLDDVDGSLKLNRPDLEPDQMPADGSCALDVADRGGTPLEEVGAIYNVTRERIRQIESMALLSVVRNAGAELVQLAPDEGLALERLRELRPKARKRQFMHFKRGVRQKGNGNNRVYSRARIEQLLAIIKERGPISRADLEIAMDVRPGGLNATIARLHQGGELTTVRDEQNCVFWRIDDGEQEDSDAVIPGSLWEGLPGGEDTEAKRKGAVSMVWRCYLRSSVEHGFAKQKAAKVWPKNHPLRSPRKETPMTSMEADGPKSELLSILKAHGPLGKKQISDRLGLTPFHTQKTLVFLLDAGALKAHGQRRGLVYHLPDQDPTVKTPNGERVPKKKANGVHKPKNGSAVDMRHVGALLDPGSSAATLKLDAEIARLRAELAGLEKARVIIGAP